MTSDIRIHHPTDKGGALLIYPDKGKVFGWMILNIVYVALGVVVILVPDPTPKYPRGVTQFAGVCWIVFMGIGAIGCLVRLFSSAPALIINREGIFINSTLFKIGPIGWSEIAELRAYHVWFQNRLTIVVTDPHAMLERQPVFRRVIYTLIKGNLMRSGRMVTADSMLPISIYELLADIREHYHHELLHFQIVIRERQRK